MCLFCQPQVATGSMGTSVHAVGGLNPVLLASGPPIDQEPLSQGCLLGSVVGPLYTMGQHLLQGPQTPPLSSK